MNTGIIFESKNGRWIVTRGEGRWRVTDTLLRVKIPVSRIGETLVCKEPLPGYVLKHIQHDAKLLETIAKRQEMGV